MDRPTNSINKTPTFSTQSNQPSSGRLRVLIVDDEPMITNILRRMIAQDYDVHILHSSSEARDLIKNGASFDAILCDLMMPGMTGMDLHAELMQLSADQGERMVFMTGGAFTDATREFLDRVPNPRVEKPFAVANVKAAVQRVCEVPQ